MSPTDEGIDGWEVIKDMGWCWVGSYPRFRHLQGTSHVLESGVANGNQERDPAKRKHFGTARVRGWWTHSFASRAAWAKSGLGVF